MEDTFSSNERLVSLTPLLEPTDKFHVLCTWNIKQKAAELCHVTIDFVPNSMLLVICERVTMNSCGAIFFRHSWLACQSVLLLCNVYLETLFARVRATSHVAYIHCPAGVRCSSASDLYTRTLRLRCNQ